MSERCCTNCGKSVEDLPAEFWMFSTCRSCAAEATPVRWSDTGTYRKWRYFPRWHLTRHPELPEHKRERMEAMG
jgi:hypothetical protein